MKMKKDKPKTKLKNLSLTSVDFCQQGANPDAHIKLHKSVDLPKDNNSDTDQSVFERFSAFFKRAFTSAATEVQKDAQTFGNIQTQQDLNESLWKYQDALRDSLRSIALDDELENAAKRELTLQSLSEFNDVMTQWAADMYPETPISKKKKGEDDMDDKNFDLSALSEEEQKAFKGLLGKVKPAAKKNKAPAKPATTKKSTDAELGEKTDPASQTAPIPAATEPTTSSASADGNSPVSTDPAMQKAIDRMNTASERMEKSLQQQEEKTMQDVAKKYAPLGEKPEDLVKTLCAMKTAGPAAYDAYVGALDKALDAVQKSDSNLLSEIGKSNHQYEAANGSVQKAEAIAKSIREKDPTLTQQQAMTRAFEEHPELEDEYEKDYEGGKA